MKACIYQNDFYGFPCVIWFKHTVRNLKIFPEICGCKLPIAGKRKMICKDLSGSHDSQDFIKVALLTSLLHMAWGVCGGVRHLLKKFHEVNSVSVEIQQPFVDLQSRGCCHLACIFETGALDHTFRDGW
jgi:hypothetical protein